MVVVDETDNDEYWMNRQRMERNQKTTNRKESNQMTIEARLESLTGGGKSMRGVKSSIG